MRLINNQYTENDLLAFLKSTYLFNSLHEDILKAISAELEHLFLDKGDVLFMQGDQADAMYIVMKGCLEVSIIKQNSDGTILAHVKTGMPVGEMQILVGERRSATVIAIEDSDLIKIPKATFEKIADKYPEVFIHIAEIIRERLRYNQLSIFLSNFLNITDKDTLKDIAAQAEWVHLYRNEVLFQQGDQGDNFYILISGRLLSVIQDENNIRRTLGEVMPGECVGEMAVLTEDVRSASVHAARDSYLVKYTKTNFHKLIERYPQVLMRISNIVIDRLRRRIHRSKQKIYTARNIAIVPLSTDFNLSDFTERLVPAISSMKSTLYLDSRKVASLLKIKQINQVSEGEPDDIRIEAWLDEQEKKYELIVYDTDMIPSFWTKICLHRADEVLLVAQEDASPEYGEIEKYLQDRLIGVAKTLQYLVILHKGQESISSGVKTLLDKRTIENHFHVHWNNNNDFQRLARFLTGNAIGLVLGGGGARGVSHIGVIRALLEEGIPIDMIGGTSMGAIISGLYAMGLNYQDMIQTLKNFIDKVKPRKEFTLPIISLLKSKNTNEMLRLLSSDKFIEDLWINFFCVSCDLSRAETAVHRTGPLWKAIRASFSLPGIFEPVVYEGNLFIDGGVLNNLPCDIMKPLCRGYVIAVSASPETNLKLECAEMPSPWKILLSKIMPYRKPIDVPSILDVIMCSSTVGSSSQFKNTSSYADFYLHPPIDGYGLLDFSQIDDIAEIGYRHAKAKMNELKQSLRLAL